MFIHFIFSNIQLMLLFLSSTTCLRFRFNSKTASRDFKNFASLIMNIEESSNNINSGLDLQSWSQSAENSWIKHMTAEISNKEDAYTKLFNFRQVYKAHYCHTQMEKVLNPYLVATSKLCSLDIGLDLMELDKDVFLQVFSGNELLPGFETYATNYGCHSFGQWFGQLGDGRAQALGEVKNPKTGSIFELQLKGCGRTPFSRGFDGRAVLRSSIREFLASEAMFHLNISTTRALSLIGTNQGIRRAWYKDTALERLDNESNDIKVTVDVDAFDKYPPNKMFVEPGAIVCRVARSFLRLTHIELFAKRQEFDELVKMLNFICLREYPHLLQINDVLQRYIELFQLISTNNAKLVADWLRVGYVQGNMNSDNTHIAGRTIDYGPFGFVEKYDPLYQPFTSDPSGNFAYCHQPNAMSINIQVLAKSFLILYDLVQSKTMKKDEYTNKINKIATIYFQEIFMKEFSDIRRRKLGFEEFIPSDEYLWTELEQLLLQSECDYTIFFRLLMQVNDNTDAVTVLSGLEESFYDLNKIQEKMYSKWINWLNTYLKRIHDNTQYNILPPEERYNMQKFANPKFILRNWMGVLAYEKANEGDFTVLHELANVLEKPYEEQSNEISEKWFQKEPKWAKSMPGCSFFSCSS